MRKMLRLVLILAAICFVPAAIAEGDTARLRPFAETWSYQYITFGTYPYTKEGEVQPVLWRVLGVDDDGVACILSEYIIDCFRYHSEKDKDKHNPLQYKDTLFCNTCNTTVLNTLFTKDEQALLLALPDGRGLVSAPNFKELHNKKYGFTQKNKGADAHRRAKGTPYAYQKGLKLIKETRHSWYYTVEWRRCGFRYIVGDDGHISNTGIDRDGGLRAICYVRTEGLEIVSGTGKKRDPLVLRLKAE